jgi:hypothetical protein
MLKFRIMLGAIKIQDGNAIINLEPKGLDPIINQNNILQLSIGNNPKILNHFAPLSLKAMLPR